MLFSFSGGELQSFHTSTRSASNSSLVLTTGMFSSGKGRKSFESLILNEQKLITVVQSKDWHS